MKRYRFPVLDSAGRVVLALLIGFSVFGLLACGGGGGRDDDDDDDRDPGGGVGTGDGDVTIFWQTLAGPYEGWGRALDVRQTPDGGYMVTGFFGPAIGEPTDLYLAKTDPEGALVWSRVFGSAGASKSGNVVRRVPDGGYIVAGHSSQDEDLGALLIRTDAQGNALPTWPKRLLGRGINGLHATTDGFVIVGQGGSAASPPDVYMMAKLDYSGNVIWGPIYYNNPRNPGWKAATAIDATADGYIVAGIDNGPRTLVGAFRTNSEGVRIDETWPRTYGEGSAFSVRSTPDGGFVLAGKTTIPWEDGDGLLIKVDDQGNESWRRTFGGPRNDELVSVDVMPDGSIIAVGHTDSFGLFDAEQPWCSRNVFMIKITQAGETLWQKVLGRSPCSVERADAVWASADGGFVIAGESGAQPMIAKMDRTGATVGLGTHEFKVNIPAVSGKINFGNAMLIAGRGAGATILTREFAAFGLDRLLIERPSPADLCGGGGTYTPVPGPVVTGGEYSITFTECAVNGDDLLSVSGSMSVRVDQLAGTLAKGGIYNIALTYRDIDLVSEDDAGPTRFLGRLRFDRSAAGNLSTEKAVFTSFGIVENNTLQVLRSGSIDYQVNNAAFTMTSDDGMAFVLVGVVEGDLNLAIVDSVSGSAFEPSVGRMRIDADDGSSAVLVIRDGNVSIEIDTDGDGLVDGILESPWEDLI